MKLLRYFAIVMVCAVSMSISAVKEVSSKSEFNKILKDNEFVVVKFWMKDCPPCNALKPVFEKVARELSDDVMFIAVKGPSEISDEFAIRGFPTMLYFKNGKKIGKGSSRDASGLKKEIESKFGL